MSFNWLSLRVQRKWQGQRSCYNGVNQSTGCLICIFMQCIKEKGYTACRAWSEWKKSLIWCFFFLRQRCLSCVFDVKSLHFWKDKREKVTWTGVIWCRRTKLNPNIWMERMRCPEIAEVRRETQRLPSSLLPHCWWWMQTDIPVSTGQPPLGFCIVLISTYAPFLTLGEKQNIKSRLNASSRLNNSKG